jgi:hypothetical protein
MINKNKAVWLNVVDDNNCYITTIFREDFMIILNGWRINLVIIILNLVKFEFEIIFINKVKIKKE